MVKMIVAVCFAMSVVLSGNIANAENNNEAYLGNMSYCPLVWNTQDKLDVRRRSPLHDGEYFSNDSAYAETLRMTGQVVGDLNADGIPDAIVVLVHSLGGSGSVQQIAAVIGYPGKRLAHVASMKLNKLRVLNITIGRGGKIEVLMTTDDNVISSHTYHFRNNRIAKG
jgi:hypothetical protein